MRSVSVSVWLLSHSCIELRWKSVMKFGGNSYLKQSGDPPSLLLDLQGSDYFILRPEIGAVQYLRYLSPGSLANIGWKLRTSELVAICTFFLFCLLPLLFDWSSPISLKCSHQQAGVACNHLDWETTRTKPAPRHGQGPSDRPRDSRRSGPVCQTWPGEGRQETEMRGQGWGQARTGEMSCLLLDCRV